MYGNNDYRDYLEHADHKYLEKIVNGAKTRYFYTREALQGYYNSLKKGAAGASIRAKNDIAAVRNKASRALSTRDTKSTTSKGQERKAFANAAKARGTQALNSAKRTKQRVHNTITNLRGSVPGAIYRGKKAAKSSILSAWDNITKKANKAKNRAYVARYETKRALKKASDNLKSARTNVAREVRGASDLHRNKKARNDWNKQHTSYDEVAQLRAQKAIDNNKKKRSGAYASRKPR